MPVFELYSPDALAGLIGGSGTVTLTEPYDPATDTILTIDDDDGLLGGDRFANEDGDDDNQYGQAVLGDGTIIGSLAGGSETTAYSEWEYTLTATINGELVTVQLYEIEIDTNPASTQGSGTLVGYLPSIPLVPGVAYSFTRENTTPTNSDSYAGIIGAVCFTRGTLIETADGPLPIEALSVGDTAVTTEGPAKIRWIGSHTYQANALFENPKLLPVRMVAGALGNGLPRRDLLTSRQHRMLVSSKIVQRVCGTDEALIAAIKLTDLPGIFVDDSIEEVEYFHILFDRHEVIFAEGAPSESLFAGPEALRTLPKEAREEVFTIFPELIDLAFQPKPARVIPDGSTQKTIIRRHLKNSKPLLDPKSARPLNPTC
ncbi:Hint domain-containing protein [Actibacterium ureilyticum]|uniref:Hint domain-containing protein n=1 Tax=Actibacterium ureilyticum TaxID=1590614 RepID=UPI000BAAC45C|nr:Hint domain-containing protein [Actibacterium ureilyticum]